jgi:hypothetical protein
MYTELGCTSNSSIDLGTRVKIIYKLQRRYNTFEYRTVHFLIGIEIDEDSRILQHKASRVICVPFIISLSDFGVRYARHLPADLLIESRHLSFNGFKGLMSARLILG